MNEVQLIDKFLKRLTKKKSSSQGLNDDIFFDKSNKLAVSVDTYVQKVHFPNFKAPDLVIKKILRSSLSDLICKGVKPKYYFISASGNSKSFSNKNLKKISNSLSLEQKKFDIELSGGDTVYSNTNSFTCCVLVFHLFPQLKLLHSRFFLLEKSLFKNTIYYFLIIIFRSSLRMPH